MPLTSITAWESLFDRLGFVPEEKANVGKSVLIIGGAGAIVTTRQETLTGLTAENIRTMHVKQESGTMMGKQVLVL